MLRTFFRRLTRAALIGALGALVASWFRNREQEAMDPAIPTTAQWKPLEKSRPPAQADSSADAITEPSDGSAADAAQQEWVTPDADGNCPAAFPVKVKLKSGIYHLPDGSSYSRTKPDRCYATAADAEADGYRASKS